MTLGILVVAPYGRVQFRYAFTPADVVWLGRLLAAASNGQYPVRPRALLWKALTRFGASGRSAQSLAAFIQRLEPSLPRVPWGQLPPAVRQLALSAGTGALRRRNPNAPISVMPRGGAAVPGGYGYGGQPSARGWAGEAELFETTPAEPGATPAAAPDPAAPPASAPAPDAVAEEPAPAGPDDAADLSAGGGGGGAEPPMADEPPPPPAAFNTKDGNRLVLNSQLLRRLMRAYRRRHPRWGMPFDAPGFAAQPAAYPYRTPYGTSPYARAPYGGYPRWRPPVMGAPFVRPWAGQAVTGRPLAARRALVGRLQRLAQRARRVGTLRSVRSGRRYPVFGGQVGGKNYRIVTRPRRGMQHEIMLVRGGALQQELAG